MPCLPAMRSEPKIGRCSHPSSPRAGSTTSTPSLTSPKPSRLSSMVTHKARSKTSCPGDSERRQPQVLRGSSKRLHKKLAFDCESTKTLRCAISGEALKGLCSRFEILRSKNALLEDKQVVGSSVIYGDPVFEEFLIEMLPRISEIVGRDLFPTYSFARYY